MGLATIEQLALVALHEGLANGWDQVVAQPDDLVILVAVIAE
jgi:hypothetical protein